MSTIRRTLIGLVLTALTVLILVIAAKRLTDALTVAQTPATDQSEERSFTVEALPLTASSFAPLISAFGEIQAWRTLELRASTGGTIVDLPQVFRDGATVSAGDLLFSIDTRTAQSGVDSSELALAEAQTELLEMQANQALVEAEVEAAGRQLELQQRELRRQQQLFEKGLVAQGAVEAAELAVASARQTLSTRRQSRLSSQMRLDTAKLSLEKAQISLSDAATDLTETQLFAPFDGQLAEVSATLGRRVAANEKLALLIDTNALEAAFQVRDIEFARLLGRDGSQGLDKFPVAVTLELGDREVVVGGVLDRTAATVNPRQGGRTVYARLDSNHGRLLRPGDFVRVTVQEPVIDDVVVVDSTAVGDNGTILVIGDNDRLQEHTATVVRRQGDKVVLTDVPLGRLYVSNRVPQLGPGIKVKVRNSENRLDQDHFITLDAERRAKLIAHVQSNKRMPEARRQRVIGLLNQERVPKEVVDRIETRLNQEG